MSDCIRSVGHNPYCGSAGYADASSPAPAADSSSSVAVEDKFQPTSSSDLTPEGKLRFIFSFDDAESAKVARQDLEAKEKSTDLGQHCRMTENYPLVNGFAMDVDPNNVGDLLRDVPVGSHIALDRQLDDLVARDASGSTNLIGAAKTGKGKKAPATDVANALIGIDKVWDKGFTGKGQTIAIIDSGIYQHPDLKDKIVGWVDVHSGKLEPYDDHGHGTHVAGIAAGNGVSSAGKHKGVAPDANVVGVRISNVSDAIKGIQWVIEHKEEMDIGVINMSLGDFAMRSYKDDPWAQAAQKAMEAGMVVCVAAGNDGPSEFNINTPGTHPDLITVGALDDKGTVGRDDDTVADFSSRGPTSVDNLRKPDVLAPGVNVYGPLSPGSNLDEPDAPHDGAYYFAISGTSMATPMVAGLAAVLRQANPSLSPQEIKEILVRSADNYLPEEPDIQGAGLINAERALDLALNWDHEAEAENVRASVERNRTPVARRGWGNTRAGEMSTGIGIAKNRHVVGSTVSGANGGYLMA